MSVNLQKAVLGTAILCAAALSPAAHAAPADGGWDWIVAPYLWAASVSSDIRPNPPILGGGGVSNDSNFGNILDKIDGAFEIHVEGQHDQFGMFADYTYLGLNDKKDHPRFNIDTSLDSTLFELAGVWSPGPERFQGFDVFAGLRYINVDFTSQFDPINPIFASRRIDTDRSFSDFMLGGRYTWAFSDRFGVTLRADGSTGETDGTWNVSAVGNYKMKHGAWYFGYRHLSVSVKPDGHVIDFTMSGPEFGYGFMF